MPIISIPISMEKKAKVMHKIVKKKKREEILKKSRGGDKSVSEIIF